MPPQPDPRAEEVAMPEPTPPTPEWLESCGFKRSPMFGYILDVSPHDDPEAERNDDRRVSLTVGNWPSNEPCCAIIVAGHTIVTNAQGTEDVDALIRLLKDAYVDLPY